MDPFVSQLAELARTYPTRSKWVFVPSHAIGRTLGERIVLEGTNWANLRFVTPLDIAVRMAGPFLVEQGINPCEDGLGPALIMRLLMGLPDEHTYFKPLAEQPSMAQALWATIREMRMAGVHAIDIEAKADAFESAQKHAELVALVKAYEQYLAEHKIADIPAVYEFAPKHREYCPILDADLWTEHPDAVWAPLQRKLLDSLPGERVTPRRVDCAGLPEPRRWPLLKGNAEVTAPAPQTDAERLAFLMRPADSPPPLGDGSLSMFRAGGREAEIDEVFRRTIASDTPLDQIEIACALPEYAPVIWEKAIRLEWPVTIAAGVPATHTRPGRALLAWCNWLEGDFAAVDLRHLLQSGDVELDMPVELSPGKAARLLARAEPTWGRQTYSRALGRLKHEYEEEAADAELSDQLRTLAQENAQLCGALQSWVQSLVDAVPQTNADKRLPLEGLLLAAESFVETCSARKSALDNVARERLSESVAELHALGAFSCSLTEALGFIRERVESLTIAPDRSRPGALFISPLSQCAHAGRPRLFIVGLEEGRVFPSRTEDPVLLDSERQKISEWLRTADDKVDELQHQIVSRLGSASATSMCFSYSCRDTREYRETLPSWLLLQVARIAVGNPSLNYDGLEKHIGEPCSSVPATPASAVSEAGWWLAAVKSAPIAGRAAVLASFEQAARGEEARTSRSQDGFTEFDGLAHAAGKLLDPCVSGRPISATTLEAAASCPFQFFIKYGLHVEPVPDAERDRDAWLDALTRGSELHDLFARLMRRCRKEKRRPDLKKDKWIFEIASKRLDEIAIEAPPPSPEVFAREKEDFLKDLQLFVKYEATFTGGTPVGLEVSFGRMPEGDGDEAEELASADPIEIDLGKGRRLQLRGRIDRIDCVDAAKHEYDVIDYKTGLYWKDGWEGTFAEGTRLQHALYGLAAVRLLKKIDAKAKIRNGVYFFPSLRGNRARKEIPAPSLAKSTDVIGDVIEVIRHGVFVHTPTGDACTFCDFAAACGPDAVVRAKAKVANASDRKLDPFRRLQQHD